jgi:hypothetical protein
MVPGFALTPLRPSRYSLGTLLSPPAPKEP